MKKNKSNNKRIKIIALILILVITLGYAALRTNLNINGIATIPRVAWDVYFANYQNSASTNITPTTEPSTPTGTKPTTITYAVILSQPGDVYEFTIDTVNAGTIDAMIESYQSTIKVGDNLAEDATNLSNIPNYLDYTVTYDNGSDIAQNQLLEANTSEKIKVHIGFKEDITAEQLAQAAGKTITFAVTINYKQADSTAISKYKLIIHYISKSGDYIAEDYVGYFYEGSNFHIVSPIIANYNADFSCVDGEMPNRKLELYVPYKLE